MRGPTVGAIPVNKLDEALDVLRRMVRDHGQPLAESRLAVAEHYAIRLSDLLLWERITPCERTN